MKPLDRALVADGSSLCRHLFDRLLRPLALAISTAHRVEDALLAADSTSFDLVLADMELPGGGAPALLAGLERTEGPKPFVVVLARAPRLDWETEVSLAGASACLPKPLSFGALARVVWQMREHPASPPAAPRVQYDSPLSATILDESGHKAVRCEVRNLSRSGAFLLSHAPVALGSLLRLRLSNGRQSADLLAEVIRIQEPSWDRLPGVGVAFREGADRLAGLLPEGD